MADNYLNQPLEARQQRVRKRGWRCPDEVTLAAYADRTELSADLKESIEGHLAGCESCLAQVSFLVKSAEWPEGTAVPFRILSRARNLVSQKRSTWVWGWRWAMATAAAACLVFAALLGIALRLGESRQPSGEPLVAQNQPPQSTISPLPSPAATAGPSGLKSSETPAPVTYDRPKRSAEIAVRRPPQSGPPSPAMKFPSEGAVVTSADLLFRWTTVNEAEFYEISVMTNSGDPVFAARSEQAQIKLPDDVQLRPGGKYFVQITANLAQGTTVKSQVVSFRVSR